MYFSFPCAMNWVEKGYSCIYFINKPVRDMRLEIKSTLHTNMHSQILAFYIVDFLPSKKVT